MTTIAGKSFMRPTPIDDFTPETVARFWALVDKSIECWLWTAGINDSRKRYGVFYLGTFRPGCKQRQKVYAHRYSYALVHGHIEPGLVIDHLCNNPTCVRPDHLEAVTNKENLARAGVPEANSARMKGHPDPCRARKSETSPMVDAVASSANNALRLAAHLSSDPTACSRGRRVGSEVLAGRPVAGGQGGQQDPGNHHN